MKLTSWEQYWFRPAPYVDLAMVRIITVATQLCLLAPLVSSDSLAQLNALPDLLYNPITALRIFLIPLGVERPSPDMLVGLYYITMLAGVLALIGLATRASLLVFALGNIFEIAYVYSFGDLHHTQAPLFIALLVLALAPSGHALSVDALLRRRRGAPVATEGPMAGWPIRLLQWLFVLIYLSAIINKLVFEGGPQWLNGYTLQYFLIQDSLRKGTLLGMWLSTHHNLVMLGQYVVVIFQATFSLAVIFPRLRWIYVPLGLGFHVGNIFFLNAPFPQWIALYSIFIPWTRFFELLRERPILWRQRPGPA